jgi:quinol monooxygenase YgiN
MTQPIVFVSKHKVRPGKVDALKSMSRTVAAALERDKPGTVVYLSYLDADETELTTVHVFPDVGAMETHMAGVADRAKAAAELLEYRTFELYRPAPEAALAMMRQVPGAEVRVAPKSLAGYVRPMAAPQRV